VIEQALHRKQIDVLVDHRARVGVAERVRLEPHAAAAPVAKIKRFRPAVQRADDERVAHRPLATPVGIQPREQPLAAGVVLIHPGAVGGDRLGRPV
jgi:hypothetical protein